MSCYSSLALLLICLCRVSLITAKSLSNGFSVELIHRDSPRSPLYNPKQTLSQRVSNAVHRSINRANQLNTPETTITSNRGEYLMSYSIGTPPFQSYGIVDTGSDIIWLQCKPCDSCYPQTSPIFDPSQSSTYKTIPCSSTTCQSLRFPSCSNSNTCGYTINYGDGSMSKGDLSVETLTLDSTNNESPISFPGTVIGCGHNDTGNAFQGISSGIVGLAGGPLSLITQLGPSISRKLFSYCLVPIFSESNTTSKLSFGDAAVVSGPRAVSTPIVPSSDKILYRLTLEAFSVGNNRIEFGGSTSEGNIIIDSGTTLTLLPENVYSNLESAVAAVVTLERVQDPTQHFNLCYKTTSSSGELDVPVITAHFSGADVQLNALNTFIQVVDGVVCFAFASTQLSVGAIFGNLAQQNLLVGYDLQKNIVSFMPTDCTK